MSLGSTAVKVATLLGSHFLEVKPAGPGRVEDDTNALENTTVPFTQFRNMPDNASPIEWEEGLKKVLAMDWERMIPGHPGPGDSLGTKKDVQDQLEFLEYAAGADPRGEGEVADRDSDVVDIDADARSYTKPLREHANLIARALDNIADRLSAASGAEDTTRMAALAGRPVHRADLAVFFTRTRRQRPGRDVDPHLLDHDQLRPRQPARLARQGRLRDVGASRAQQHPHRLRRGDTAPAEARKS
mgnify:CR=1 FL=1